MEKSIFYCPSPDGGTLPDTEAHHVHKVLRARPGTEILITDGKGICADAIITEVTPKTTKFQITNQWIEPRRPYRVRIAIAPTRKPERNEWMLEKLVELGVDQIDFIKTTYTHQESFGRVLNQERLDRIAQAAMKQSRQYYLPDIRIGQSFSDLLKDTENTPRFIAYVPDKSTAPHLVTAAANLSGAMVLIGPEGDFTKEEVSEAIEAAFQLVSLGNTRLRTETAAVIACHSVHLANLHSA